MFVVPVVTVTRARASAWVGLGSAGAWSSSLMIAAPPTLFRGSLDDPSPVTDLEYEPSFFLKYSASSLESKQLYSMSY